MTTKIFLVRHAEAEGNLFRVAHGQYDSVITPRGYRQLAYLRERFKNQRLDAVYGSDLTRTHTTASTVDSCTSPGGWRYDTCLCCGKSSWGPGSS